MNKMVKMPVFLGITGAACALVLAGVYAFTNPITTQNKLNKANAAYISMYSSYAVTATDIVEADVSETLYNGGCTTKVVIEKAKGACYTCSAKGYAGTFSFQVAFANGQYLGYTDLGNSETSGYGAAVIGEASNLIKGADANTPLMGYDKYTSYISGRSITGKALASAVEACRADYLALCAEKGW